MAQQKTSSDALVHTEKQVKPLSVWLT